MKWFLVIAVLLAVTNIVTSRPNKEKDNEYEDVLNDEDDGYITGEDDDDEEDGENEALSDPPVIKTLAQNFTATLGSTVNLPCITENAESYSVMWKMNKVMIFQDKIQVGQRNSRFVRFDNQTLQIRKVQASDSGSYECSISTSPKLTALTHNLNVLTPPRIVKATVNNKQTVTVERGGSLELECIAEGNPTPKVSWSKKGQRVSAEHSEYGNSRVYKQNIGRDDNGIYICMADNEFQKEPPVLQTVNVEVTHRPDMKIESVIAGETEMHLICKVHANPTANVTWMKNKKPVKVTDNVVFDHGAHGHDHAIKFLKVDDSNFGNYTCIAKNHFGQTERHIVVSGIPLVPKYDNHRFVGENNELKTTWTISSMTPISKIQLQYRKKGDAEKTWITEDAEISEQPGYAHNIDHILKNLGQGVYEARLRAENQYGWSDYSRAVSIEGKPSADSISKKEDPAEEKIGEPESSTGSGSRTIISWTSVLLVILLNMYSSFV